MKVEDLIRDLKELDPNTEVKFFKFDEGFLENMKGLKSLLRTSQFPRKVWKFF